MKKKNKIPPEYPKSLYRKVMLRFNAGGKWDLDSHVGLIDYGPHGKFGSTLATRFKVLVNDSDDYYWEWYFADGAKALARFHALGDQIDVSALVAQGYESNESVIP